jgi:putative nucleotidyltransferase with HDIG domain
VIADAPSDRARVLVVDDDPTFGGLVADLVRQKGHDAVQCLSPQEALEHARTTRFDTAIVDLVMPGMGGIELADRLKAGDPDLQVLILTGHGDIESAIAGIQHGVFDYLQKADIDLPRLERAVRDAVQRSRLLRDNRALLAQLRESNHRLSALHQTTAQIGGEPHLDRLLAELVAAAKTLTGTGAGRAMLFDAGADRLVVSHAEGDGAGTLPGMRLSVTEGIALAAHQASAAVLVPVPAGDPRFSARIDGLPTTKPGLICAPLRHRRVSGVLMVGGRETGELGPADRDVLEILARHAAVAIDNAVEHERGINFFTHTSNILVSFLENIDIFYPGHSRATARLADMITRRMGLSEPERRSVHFAALLHDIGKLLVPPEILRAASIANESDLATLRSHPALAFEMLKPITVWEEILPMIHAHHERWDGKGYPLGTAGDAIPLGARIISVADAFDAMTRKKAHGPIKTPDEAIAELEAFSGTQFDPKIARLFIAEYRQTGRPLE